MQTEQEIEKASSQISGRKMHKLTHTQERRKTSRGKKGSVLDDLSIGCFWDRDFHSNANYCLQIRDETDRGIALRSRLSQQLPSVSDGEGRRANAPRMRVCALRVYIRDRMF